MNWYVVIIKYFQKCKENTSELVCTRFSSFVNWKKFMFFKFFNLLYVKWVSFEFKSITELLFVRYESFYFLALQPSAGNQNSRNSGVYFSTLRKTTFACLFSVHNRISFSCHGQVFLISRNVVSSNTFIHDVTNLLYYLALYHWKSRDWYTF